MSVLTRFLNWVYGTTPSAPSNKVATGSGSSGTVTTTVKAKKPAKKSAPKKKTTKKVSRK